VISHSFENDLDKGLPRTIAQLAGALEHIRWMSVPEDQFPKAVDKNREFEVVLSNWFREQ
jgi:hypothetical protein